MGDHVYWMKIDERSKSKLRIRTHVLSGNAYDSTTNCHFPRYPLYFLSVGASHAFLCDYPSRLSIFGALSDQVLPFGHCCACRPRDQTLFFWWINQHNKALIWRLRWPGPIACAYLYEGEGSRNQSSLWSNHLNFRNDSQFRWYRDVKHWFGG